MKSKYLCATIAGFVLGTCLLIEWTLFGSCFSDAIFHDPWNIPMWMSDKNYDQRAWSLQYQALGLHFAHVLLQSGLSVLAGSCLFFYSLLFLGTKCEKSDLLWAVHKTLCSAVIFFAFLWVTGFLLCQHDNPMPPDPFGKFAHCFGGGFFLVMLFGIAGAAWIGPPSLLVCYLGRKLWKKELNKMCEETTISTQPELDSTQLKVPT
jgi:hypothetical protein